MLITDLPTNDAWATDDWAYVLAGSEFYEGAFTCPGCGHPRHDPSLDTRVRSCPACAAVLAVRCDAIRAADTVQYLT